MSQALFDRVVEDVKALNPEERERIRALLDDLASESRIWTEEEFEEEMVRKGLFRRRIKRAPDAARDRDFQPLQIEGEPLSEQIIRERR